jgi:MurNAc alpha-1-phosphate uridylyltransferase
MLHLTADRPKSLVPVGGKPLIDHALTLTDTPGIGQRVVNLHYKGQMIRDHLAGTSVTFSQEVALLETGGGLRHAMPLLGTNPVITMNTDAVWNGPNPIEHLLGAWRDDMECLALLIPLERAVGHKGKGDFLMDQNGRLTWGRGPIYTGVQIIRTDCLKTIPEAAFSMTVVWDQMIARGGMFGTIYTGKWCDVGQPESIPLAEAMLKDCDV